MPPSILTPTIEITTVPLTPSSFAPFGNAVSPPLPPSISTFPPSLLSQSPLFPQQLPPVAANQFSALKYSPIAPCENKYPSATSKVPSEPRLSLFVCFPRRLRRKHEGGNEALFDIKILERHPFTTQTFIPLGLGAEDPDTEFLVVVAPSLDSSVESTDGRHTVDRPPDLKNLKAFLCRGNQAVTYAAGTWHAPMVVLGKRRVDFMVMQFVNGVAEDDCQEVEMTEGLAVDVRAGVEERRRAKL
jgi:ureidoglycolate lyase